VGETRFEARPVAPGQTPKALPLSAKSIKVVLAIDPQLLLGVGVANGVAQVPFVIAVAGRHIKGRLNAKTLRRAVGVVTASAGEGVAVIIQGRLMPGEQLEDAGIAAQPRARPDDAGNNANSVKEAAQ
jgi:hypothetical protein